MSQFALLLRLATQSLDAAAERMRLAQTQHAQQSARLQQLDDFIADYQARLLETGQQGMGRERWLDFRLFLGKLDDARLTQEREVERAQQRFLMEREAWLLARKKLKAYETLLARDAARQALKTRRREQKLVDEFAMRQFREREQD